MLLSEIPYLDPQPSQRNMGPFHQESGGTTSVSAYRLLMQEPASKFSHCFDDIQHVLDVAVLGYN
jgi:hypothetical protein